MRINARLDDEQAHALEYLKQATHASTSSVIKTAIERYFREVHDADAKRTRVLHEVGFIGCGEAESNLSETYKQVLTEELDAKHGHR